MNRPYRLLTALLAVLALTFALAACGSDEESSSSSSNESTATTAPTTAATEGSTPAGGTEIQSDPANKGKTFTVGSKNFAEQFILGEIYAQALEAAGFTVKKQLNLGSEQIAYKTLKNGSIDAYPEYSGTALTSFYRVKTDDVPRDPQEAFDLLKQDAAKDDITALPQTPFQDTYVILSSAAFAKKIGDPKTLTELADKAGNDVSISGFPECRQRTDCLLGLKSKYGWEPKFISSQGKYGDIDSGSSDLTFGFGTDGELANPKYHTYEDDKQLFPPYYVSFLVNKKGLATLGQSGQDVVQAVQKPLTEKVMAELNSRVTLDKEDPEDVAAEYLKSFGFVAK